MGVESALRPGYCLFKHGAGTVGRRTSEGASLNVVQMSPNFKRHSCFLRRSLARTGLNPVVRQRPGLTRTSGGASNALMPTSRSSLAPIFSSASRP